MEGIVQVYIVLQQGEKVSSSRFLIFLIFLIFLKRRQPHFSANDAGCSPWRVYVYIYAQLARERVISFLFYFNFYVLFSSFCFISLFLAFSLYSTFRLLCTRHRLLLLLLQLPRPHFCCKNRPSAECNPFDSCNWSGYTLSTGRKLYGSVSRTRIIKYIWMIKTQHYNHFKRCRVFPFV